MAMPEWLEIFPERWRDGLRTVPWNFVTEVRLRVGRPLLFCCGGRNVTVAEAIVTAEDLENLVLKASDYAIYAVLDQIVQGFITLRGGARLGLAGTLITEKGQVLTVQDYSSVCLRVPHAVPNCAVALLPKLFGAEGPSATLIIAPPGAGKTTLLRELARQIGEHYPDLSTLILDERGELAGMQHGVPQLPVGNCDVITGGNKTLAFQNGVRVMAPQCVVMDEIGTLADAELVRSAVKSGIVLLASVHASSLAEVATKPGLATLVAEKAFARYVVLAGRRQPGQVVAILDQDGHPC